MLQTIKQIGLVCILVLYGTLAQAQPIAPKKDSNQVNRGRLRTLVIGSSVLYGASLVGLNEVWYKNSPRQSFRWFDDSREWKQVDKLGHFYSAYHVGLGTSKAFRWAGLSKKKSVFWGAMMSIFVMTPIEVFDGFSAGYGASFSDIVANTSGALFLYGQQALWGESRIHPKISFHRTKYPHLRPELLGKSFTEEILKDYNGQTLWFSVDVDKFLPKGNRYPKWLNLAVGYGAEDMIYAQDQQNIQAGFAPYRQFYLSFDLDLTAIKTKNKLLKTLIFFVNMIHLPSPAISFSSAKGLRLHGWYY